jgi:hypothetical protein
MREDIAALQLEALSNFLAFTPRDPALPLSAQIARDAAAGNIWARRVMHSRILESPQTAERAEPLDELADAPLLSIAVTAQPAQDRQRVRNAALGIVNRRYGDRRPGEWAHRPTIDASSAAPGSSRGMRTATLNSTGVRDTR